MRPCRECYHLSCCRFNPELPNDWGYKRDENICPYYVNKMFILTLMEEHWKKEDEDGNSCRGN